MAETEIFSHLLQNVTETDSVFVRLSTDTDISVKYIKLQKMEITEIFSTGSPMITLEFVDGNGDFVNHIKPNPSTKYFLDFGRTILDSTRIELMCSKIVLLNQKAGVTEQIAFKMFFIHHGWNELINIRKSRGWKDKKYSEIVSEIAGECGYKSVSVSDTDTEVEFFVQPFWSNLKTISNIRNKSKTLNGGHMEFGANIKGEFFFKSIGDMIEEQKEAAKSKKVTVFRMEGQNILEDKQKNRYVKNNNTPTYFAHFTGEESYVDAVVNGAGGVKSMYYDSVTGEYRTSDVKYSEIETPQLADWAGIQKTHEVTNLRVYGGRDSDVTAEALNRVTDIIDSSMRFEIVSEGAPHVHIGNLVELIIPTPPNINSKVPQNITYSGFYIVCGIKHTINFNKSVMVSSISLMREGFDGKSLDGYVKSKKGKFV